MLSLARYSPRRQMHRRLLCVRGLKPDKDDAREAEREEQRSGGCLGDSARNREPCMPSMHAHAAPAPSTPRPPYNTSALTHDNARTNAQFDRGSNGGQRGRRRLELRPIRQPCTGFHRLERGGERQRESEEKGTSNYSGSQHLGTRVCTPVRVCRHVGAHLRTHFCAHMHAHTYARTYARAYARAYAHTYARL